MVHPHLCSLRVNIGEGNGTPLQYSCLENPMDGGAWKAAVHGVTEGQTRLSDFTFTFHFSLLCVEEGNGNPLQCSCLENLRDGGAWWVAIYGGHTELDTTEVTQQQQHTGAMTQVNINSQLLSFMLAMNKWNLKFKNNTIYVSIQKFKYLSLKIYKTYIRKTIKL